MGFLSSNNNVVKIYEPQWIQVGEPVAFDADDLAALKPECEVVKSTWGSSIKLTLLDGRHGFIPVSSKEQNMPIGSFVKVADIRIIQLEKDNKTIYRVIKHVEEVVTSRVPNFTGFKL